MESATGILSHSVAYSNMHVFFCQRGIRNQLVSNKNSFILLDIGGNNGYQRAAGRIIDHERLYFAAQIDHYEYRGLVF
jgi:hypothetical protein